MKKLFAFLFLASLSIGIAAQSEQPKDSTLLKRTPTQNEGLPQISPPPASATVRREMPESASPSADSITLKNISLPAYTPYLPWMEVMMGKMVSAHNPFAMDYEQYAAFPVSTTGMLSTFSTYNTYPTMGTIIQAGGSYTYRPNERWELTGGMYTAKYTIPSRMHGSLFDIGLNASAGYRINDFMRIVVFGQYSGFGEQNSLKGYMNPSYPQSYYGAILEVKINNNLEIHGGAERTYNPTKMKWETVPILYPVIRLGKKKK